MARKQMISPPQEGAEAPEFVLPAAQGGQFRLGLRTARGPVIVVSYRGPWSAECVEYFEALAEKEREINVAGATLVGVGTVEPGEAREFARATGFKSYVLYDYLREMTREYGLLERDAERGEISRPAAFLIGSDYTVLRAWPDERPAPDDLLAEVSRITGLPKEPEEEGEAEAEEKPRKRPRKSAESGGDGAAEGKTSEDGSGAGKEAKEAAPKPAAGTREERTGEDEAKAQENPGGGKATGESDSPPDTASDSSETGPESGEGSTGSSGSEEEAPARDAER